MRILHLFTPNQIELWWWIGFVLFTLLSLEILRIYAKGRRNAKSSDISISHSKSSITGRVPDQIKRVEKEESL